MMPRSKPYVRLTKPNTDLDGKPISKAHLTEWELRYHDKTVSSDYLKKLALKIQLDGIYLP